MKALPSQATFGERRFRLLLAAVTLLALAPTLYLAATQFLGYDSIWHIFIATQDRWELFRFEWLGEAHPPLLYGLVRLCAKVSSTRLSYRLPSFIPGVASVYILGLIGRQLFTNRGVALLAAAAYGLSLTMIEIFCDVRAYPLALFFVISAFWCFVEIQRTPARNEQLRRAFGFSLLVSLGLLSEYYAWLFLCACLALASLRLLRSGTGKSAEVRWMAAAFLPPLLLVAFLYFVHMRFRPPIENNVDLFYWQPGTPVVSFLWSAAKSDLSYLLPFSLTATNTVAALLLAGAFYGAIGRHDHTGRRGIPSRLFLLLFVELAILSRLRLHPFGGYARQQSILFPFLILLVFGLLDGALSFLKNSGVRIAILTLTVVLIATNFLGNWQQYPRSRREPFADVNDAFNAHMSGADVLYLDQYSLMPYFTNTYRWKRAFEAHLHCPDRVDVYDTVSRAGRHVLLLRNLDQWNFDLTRPEFYAVLANAMRQTQRRQLTLFYLKQTGDPVPDQTGVQSSAAKAGLTVGSWFHSDMEAFITFRSAF